MARASNGCGEKSKGGHQPDKQHGKHRDQCARARSAQDGVGLAVRTEPGEPQDAGMRSEVLALTADQELEYRVRIGPGARLGHFGAGNRRECDGGDCHPHPCASIASPRHFEHPSHILPQTAVSAASGAPEAEFGASPTWSQFSRPDGTRFLSTAIPRVPPSLRSGSTLGYCYSRVFPPGTYVEDIAFPPKQAWRGPPRFVPSFRPLLRLDGAPHQAPEVSVL